MDVHAPKEPARGEMSHERYAGLIGRIERRTEAEHRKDVRNAALLSGIFGGLVAGNLTLTYGTLIYAIGYGALAVGAYVCVLLRDRWKRRKRKRALHARPQTEHSTREYSGDQSSYSL